MFSKYILYWAGHTFKSKIEILFYFIKESKITKILTWAGTWIIVLGVLGSTALVSAVNYFSSNQLINPAIVEASALINEQQFDVAHLKLSSALEDSSNFDYSEQIYSLIEECNHQKEDYINGVLTRLDSMSLSVEGLKINYENGNWKDHKKCCLDLEFYYHYSAKQLNNCNELINNKASSLCADLEAFNIVLENKEKEKIIGELIKIIVELDSNSFMISKDTIIVTVSPDITKSKEIKNYHDKIEELVFNNLNCYKAVYRVYDEKHYKNELEMRKNKNRRLRKAKEASIEDEIFLNSNYKQERMFKFKERDCSGDINTKIADLSHPQSFSQKAQMVLLSVEH